MGSKIEFDGKSKPSTHLDRLIQLRRAERDNTELKKRLEELESEMDLRNAALLEVEAARNGLNNLLITVVKFWHDGRLVIPQANLDENGTLGGNVMCETQNGQVILTVSEAIEGAEPCATD